MRNVSTTLWAAALTAAMGAAAAMPAATSARAQDCPGNPDAIGTSRTIEVDPAEYQQVGTLQYPLTVPLNDHEVVLTFDDGPLPPSSTAVLNTLAAQCVKATFFLVGEMAHSFPAVVKRIYQDGHTIGTHSEDHPLRFGQLPIEKMRWEIDQGIANVGTALGDPSKLAPFFRIPGFARSDTVEDELAARSLIVFSTDTVEDDWRRHITPRLIIDRAISRLEAKGKGMLLLHDIHPWTAAALPELLKELKDHGFRIVHLVPKPGAVMVARSELTVAWSMADQDVLDDSSNGPSWPKLSESPAAGTAELPAPDEGAFDPSYALARAENSGDIEVASADEATLAPTPWPHRAPVVLPAVDAQLPVPSVLDIGWPVKAQPVARVAPVINAELDLRSGFETSAPAARAAAAGAERSDPHHGRFHRAQLLRGHHQARVHAGAHAAAHAGTKHHHAGLLSTLAALLTPSH
jgi:peptidoglycan/xylan/chitin deacetylase (PgdA/CDA1 family)